MKAHEVVLLYFASAVAAGGMVTSIMYIISQL